MWINSLKTIVQICVHQIHFFYVNKQPPIPKYIFVAGVSLTHHKYYIFGMLQTMLYFCNANGLNKYISDF